MAVWLAKRILEAVLVVLATVVAVALVVRLTLAGLDPTRGFWGGTVHDAGRMLLHADFGHSSALAGRPAVVDMFARAWGPDVWLLAGGVVIGALAGTWAGAFCAAHPGSVRTRVLEALTAFWLCAPVYVAAFGLLLLFEPTFGRFPVPLFFEPGSYRGLGADPWHWLQGMLVPWLLTAAPVGAAVLRLSAGGIREQLDEPYVRTAQAKGVAWGRVVRGHAGRPTLPLIATFLGIHARQIMLNVVLVENVFFVPGFLVQTQPALNNHDIPVLAGLAVWTAALSMAVVVLSDVAALALDPRVRR